MMTDDSWGKMSSKDMLSTIQAYKKQKPLDDKNVYLDRLIRANLVAFKEAMRMSDAVKEIILETAEENGWLDDRREKDKLEKAKEIAKKLLLLGRPVEEVAEATALPVEIVSSLL